MAKKTAPQEEVVVTQAAAEQALQEAMGAPTAAPITEEDLIGMAEQWMQGQVERAMAQVTEEMAEPRPWWDVYVLGPFQTMAPYPGPLAPHQVLKVGQQARIVTVVYLNRITNVIATPPTTACAFLTSFGIIPYTVNVQTGNKSTWALAAGPGLQASQNGVLAPFGRCSFFNVFTFTPTTVGLHEMTVTARVGPVGSAAPFGAYGTWIYDPDADYVLPGALVAGLPLIHYGSPVIFHVYE